MYAAGQPINFFFLKKVILVDGETNNSFIIEIETSDHNTHVSYAP
jgi:hypothetical protein